MKKILIILCVLLLISGCNKSDIKELTCTGKVSDFDTTVIIKYDENISKVVSADVKYVGDLSGSTDEQIEAIKNSNLCEKFTDYNLDDCSSEVEDKNIIINAKFNPDSFNDKDEKHTIEDVKNEYEKQLNVKCVVK